MRSAGATRHWPWRDRAKLLGFAGAALPWRTTHGQTRYSLRQGPPLAIAHHNEPITVTVGQPLSLPISELSARKAPKQPAGRRPARRGTSS